jgi:peptide/nickel transport system ATP-binding protein
MLRIEDLTLSFRSRNGVSTPALSGISLSLMPGEVAGLIGASGAGKSLIASAIMGSLPPNATLTGRMTLDGTAARAGKLALAPQGVEALDPLATVAVQIQRFATLAKRKVLIGPLLARVGLSADVAAKYPCQLSGGMAKRVLLATALAQQTDYIIADEPTLGLDPAAADGLMAILAGLAGDGKAVLVISHDLPRLTKIARRITILQSGRAVETAPASAFRGEGAALQHPFSRALWQAQTGEIAWA